MARRGREVPYQPRNKSNNNAKKNNVKSWVSRHLKIDDKARSDNVKRVRQQHKKNDIAM